MGKKSLRDNFPKHVVDKLKGRVGNHCSNPACDVPTVGPQAGSDKVATIGVAAHISAASPGGPRYRSDMTPSERKSFSNGIWLCQSCSVLIDRDVDTYPESLLNDWKAEAERLATSRRGKKPPSDKDAIEMFGTAFTGYAQRLIPNAIANIHGASTRVLEALDPRFLVKSSYDGEVTHFELHAKENANIQLHVTRDYANEYKNKFSKLIETGEDLEISSEGISFSGSKLIEELRSQASGEGKLKISAPRKPAALKIWVQSDDGAIVEYFDDVIGEVAFGTREFKFSGHAYKKILEMTLEQSIQNDKPGSYTFNIDIRHWNGQDIRYLPYYPKIKSLVKRLLTKQVLHCSLEIEGVHVLTGKGVNLQDAEFLQALDYWMAYTSEAQHIAKYLNVPIYFNTDQPLPLDNFEEVYAIARICEGNSNFTKNNLNSNPSFVITQDDDSDNESLLNSAQSELIFKESESSTVQIFAIPVSIPPRTTVIQEVEIKVTQLIDENASKKSAMVELIPKEDCRITVSFQREVNPIHNSYMKES